MKDIKFIALLEKEDEPLNSYKQLLDREKLHYTDVIEGDTKFLITNDSIEKKDIKDFVLDGGIVLAENQKSFKQLNIKLEDEIIINELFFERYNLVNAVYPTIAKKYYVNEKIEETIGLFKTHEKRIVKNGMNIGCHPLIQKIKIGKGIVYLSSICFANYLNYNGSILRNIKNKTSETDVSERISKIDKGLISTFLINTLKEISKEAGIPIVEFDYLPDKAEKVFIFRMDLDGTPTDHTVNNVVELCKKYKIPGTFYANKSYMESSPNYVNQILSINDRNEIGNHGVVHNIFDDYEGNLNNINGCNDWLKEIGVNCHGFVAPRGIWSPTLDEALEEAGFDYSSDFGINFNDLPFRPYIDGKPSKILQIPVNPYCVGRAELYNKESAKGILTDDDVLDYYTKYMNDETGEIGNGFVFIYGHPQGIGKRLNVIEKIFKKVNDENYKIMSVREFKDWWLFRESIDFSIIENELGDYLLNIDDKYTPFIKKCSQNIIVKSIK